MLCPGEKPDQADGNNQKEDPNDHPLEGVHNGLDAARPMPMVIAHLEPGPAMTGTISADISGVNLASAEVRGT
jgi:hypothetical protein